MPTAEEILKGIKETNEELAANITKARELDESLKDGQDRVKALLESDDTKKSIQKLLDDQFEASKAEFEAAYKGGPQTDVGQFKSLDHAVKSGAYASEERVNELQELNDALYFAGHYCAKANANAGQGEKSPLDFMKEASDWDRFQEVAKTMTTGGAGTGQEWVPTGFSQNLIDDIRAELRVAANVNEITTPHNPFTLNLRHGLATPKKKTTEGGALTASDETSANATFDVETLYVYIAASDEMAADSAFALFPALRDGMARAAGEGEESAHINGDDTDGNSHFDSDRGAGQTDHVDRILDGFRYRIHGSGELGTSAGGIDMGGAVATTAKIRETLALMGKYGVKPQDLMIVCSLVTYLNLLGDSNVITVDKYGAGATILTGELARVYGIPIIPSGEYRDALNASGVYDGVTTDLTSLIIVNRRTYLRGRRKAYTFESDRTITTQTTDLVISSRFDLQHIVPSGGVNVAELYNIDNT